jgi:hypothetical protein
MPATATQIAAPLLISRGAGMTAGLELVLIGSTFVLVDQTPDRRFAADVAAWTPTVAPAGLNPRRRKQRKDATPAQ